MYDLEIYKNGTLNAFDTMSIHNEETAKQALLKSDNFMTLTSWARAKQLYEISKYLTKSKIVETCTALNKTQIYDDIATGKYISLVDKITFYDDKEKGLYFKNYSTFTLFVKYITNCVKDIIKGFTKQDKIDFVNAKRETYKPLTIESFEKAVEIEIEYIGIHTLSNKPDIYNMSAKEFKAWASGKDLTEETATEETATEETTTEETTTEETATEETASEETATEEKDETEETARKLFEKAFSNSKKSNNYTLNDIAIRFMNLIVKEQQKN